MCYFGKSKKSCSAFAVILARGKVFPPFKNCANISLQSHNFEKALFKMSSFFCVTLANDFVLCLKKKS